VRALKRLCDAPQPFDVVVGHADHVVARIAPAPATSAPAALSRLPRPRACQRTTDAGAEAPDKPPVSRLGAGSRLSLADSEVFPMTGDHSG
jgi:hypothetical protein